MLETKQQKKYFATAMVLVLILTFVSLFDRSSFNFVDNTDYNKKPAFDYEAYLASIKVDPVASKELFESIISEEEIKKEVERELRVDSKVVFPVIDEKKIKVTNQTGSEPIIAYFKNQLGLLQDLENITSESIRDLYYTADANSISKVAQQVVDQLYALPVPQEAKSIHSSQLVAMEGYMDIIRTAVAYQDNSQLNPWPQVYNDHRVIEKASEDFDTVFDKLDKKYSINEVLQNQLVNRASGNAFIHPASAFLGFGDIVIDIKAVFRDIYKTVLNAAYVQFAKEFLDRLIAKIETNYKIANFLYYTDALVSGQYVDDYIDKYAAKATSSANSALDRAIIKNFIPKISCGGQQQNLSAIFSAKANQYLGFEPSTLSPNDPQYYQKMAKAGNFLSDPSGWQLYYQDVAEQAQAEAEKAAEHELYSQGLKAGRDPKTAKEISTTMASVSESLRAALYSFFNVGTVLADTTAGMIAGTAVQVFINSYLFKGVVFKEQRTCIAVPQISPLVPAAPVPAPNVTPPNEEDIRDELDEQQCREGYDNSAACARFLSR